MNGELVKWCGRIVLTAAFALGADKLVKRFGKETRKNIKTSAKINKMAAKIVQKLPPERIDEFLKVSEAITKTSGSISRDQMEFLEQVSNTIDISYKELNQIYNN